MPRLLLFAPCLKLITSLEDASVSLVSVLESVNVLVPPSVELTGVERVPVQWSIIALWWHEPDDEGKTFEQRVQIVLPDGQVNELGNIPFTVAQRTHRNTISVEGFRVGQLGEHWLQLSLREQGTNEDWRVLAEYPVYVAHTQAEIPVELEPPPPVKGITVDVASENQQSISESRLPRSQISTPSRTQRKKKSR